MSLTLTYRGINGQKACRKLAESLQNPPAELFECFPDAGAEHSNLLSAHERLKAARQRFNGALVARLTGRSGKALGELMMTVNRTHPTLLEDLGEWSDRQLHDMVMRLHSA